MISDDEVRRLLGSIEIPSCPAVLTQLAEEARKEECDLQRLGRLVARDVALSAGVLKIANSPIFGLRGTVVSIPNALNLLGLNSVLNLVTTELLRSAFAKDGGALDRFWENTVMTAQVSQLVAKRSGFKDVQSAYLFGLFHDAGIPVLMRRFANYRDVLKSANFSEDGSFTDVEDGLCGTNHAVVGHLLARSWGLPSVITQAILLHHDYSIFEKDSKVDGGVCQLVAITLIAEHVVGLQLRMSTETEWSKGKERMVAHMGYSEDELSDLLSDLSDEVAQIKAAG